MSTASPEQRFGARDNSGVEGSLPFDLRRLRYVVAVAEHLSFRRAAQALETRPSNVSRAVSGFEDDIGVALFERGSFGVRLTDAGARFLSQTGPALQQIRHAIVLAGAAGRVEMGTIRIGVVSSLAGGPLRFLIRDYKREHPGVGIDMRDGGRREHLRAIHARDLDVAFLTGNSEIAGCDTVELWRERLHIALPGSHRLADCECLDWSEMREERFIVSRYEPGSDIYDYIVRRIANLSPYPVVEYRRVFQGTLMHLVGLGDGITLVSEAWTHMTFPDVVMVPLTDPEDLVPFSAVWSPRNDNPSLRRFISFARSKHDIASG